MICNVSIVTKFCNMIPFYILCLKNSYINLPSWMMFEHKVLLKYHTGVELVVIEHEVPMPILFHGQHELETTIHALEQ